jgi:DNA-binding response OmpR family regulator
MSATSLRNSFARTPRLLIVEDDPDVRLFMVLALRSEGYEVTSASDATEAFFHLNRKHFDLVLTDFGLPGKDGIAMVEEAEREGMLSGTKVMMLTAYPWLAREARMPVLLKPINFDELAGQLKVMLSGCPA